MNTSLRSCQKSPIVSFPLRTSIHDLNDYYKSINQQKPNISAKYNPRANNPNFKDTARTTGEIDENMNSMIVTYNDIKYTLQSAQLTMKTHDDWLVSSLLNKIDFICTFENSLDIDPRFVIIVVPIVIDNTITVDNPYLNGLAYMTEDSTYSLQSIFEGLNNFVFYTTCLEPHGDGAFVYVNTDCIKVSQQLYNNLLSVWTNQDLNMIQHKIQDNVTPLKNNLNSLFKQIQQSSDIQQIQNQITNIQAATQVAPINSLVETWSKYTPPYDIVLNVPAAVIAPPVPTSSSEGFTNFKEGFQSGSSGGVGATGSGGLGGSSPSTSSGTTSSGTTSSGTTSSGTRDSTNSMKCVPLDLDNAIDSSGNINFDADGNVILSDLEAQREAIKGANPNTNLINLAEYVAIFLGVLIGVVGILYGIYRAILFIKGPIFGTPTVPLPVSSENTGFYFIIALIIGFCGFLVGAFSKSY
jgi:hypothetical protein